METSHSEARDDFKPIQAARADAKLPTTIWPHKTIAREINVSQLALNKACSRPLVAFLSALSILLVPGDTAMPMMMRTTTRVTCRSDGSAARSTPQRFHPMEQPLSSNSIVLIPDHGKLGDCLAL